MKRLILLGILWSPFAFGASFPVIKGDDTLVVSGVCLYDATDGTTFYTTADSEDAGLKITLRTNDGTDELVYDAASEIEPITTIDTWEAPTASNVRFEIQDNNSPCYQLMFAADSIDTGEYAILTIEDTSAPEFLPRDFVLDYRSTSTDLQGDVVSALTTFGAATETNVDANETKIDAVDANVDAVLADTTAIGSPSDLGSGATLAGNLTDIEGQTDDIGVAGAGLTAVIDAQCEDQGGGLTCREAMSLLIAEALGTCTYTPGTRTWVCSDPSGSETRFTLVYGTDLDGDRDTSTPAPFTP